MMSLQGIVVRVYNLPLSSIYLQMTKLEAILEISNRYILYQK